MAATTLSQPQRLSLEQGEASQELPPTQPYDNPDPRSQAPISPVASQGANAPGSPTQDQTNIHALVHNMLRRRSQDNTSQLRQLDWLAIHCNYQLWSASFPPTTCTLCQENFLPGGTVVTTRCIHQFHPLCLAGNPLPFLQ